MNCEKKTRGWQYLFSHLHVRFALGRGLLKRQERAERLQNFPRARFFPVYQFRYNVEHLNEKAHKKTGGELDSSNHLGWMSRAFHRSFTKCLPFHARTCKIQQGRSAKRRPVPLQNLHLNKIKDCTSGNTSALEFQIGQFMGCWKIP